MMLSKRLQAIASCVDEDVILADIGSDHAYIPCALAKAKMIKKAYACDVNEGPLENARKTIARYGVGEKVEAIRCNGLAGIGEDTEEIIIAGMGFDTIQTILEDSYEKLRHYKKIIVQSNHDVKQLREWISDRPFTIIEEKLVWEGFYYQIICFRFDENAKKLSEDACEYGVLLREDPLYPAFLRHQMKKIDEILEQLSPKHEKYTLFQQKRDQILRKIAEANKL
ncbi:class I SAM-dependent methyltransferase [Massilicoli timonensis]|uniref:tRNA (adenine(22)-N(1))-methyltransferase n=2 Tax=Massilicoli timonensis TaxID=2015901 RepID=UPI000C86357A